MITKLRVSKLTLEMPKEDSEVWLHITVQKVIKDDLGVTTNIIPRFDYISKPLSEVYMDVYKYQDIMLGGVFSISGVGIAQALTSAVLDFMQDKYGGVVTSNGDLIV